MEESSSVLEVTARSVLPGESPGPAVLGHRFVQLHHLLGDETPAPSAARPQRLPEPLRNTVFDGLSSMGEPVSWDRCASSDKLGPRCESNPSAEVDRLPSAGWEWFVFVGARGA
jgi:hypothetical protein